MGSVRVGQRKRAESGKAPRLRTLQEV